MLTLNWHPFHPSVTAVAHERSWSFFQKCWWQVTPKQAYTLDPTQSEWTDYATVQTQCGNLSGDKLTGNLPGNTLPQSSQLAEPLWTHSGLQSGISVHKLIYTSEEKEKKKKRAGGE